MPAWDGAVAMICRRGKPSIAFQIGAQFPESFFEHFPEDWWGEKV